MTNVPNSTDLRKAVRKWLKDHKTTEAELSRNCNIDQSTLMRFMNGANPRLDTAHKISNVINAK